MLNYNLLEERIIHLETNVDFAYEQEISIEAKANATMKVPNDKSIKQVLFEVNFNAHITEDNKQIIDCKGIVIVGFDEIPDYEELQNTDCSSDCIEAIVKRIDNVLSAMGFDNLCFSR